VYLNNQASEQSSRGTGEAKRSPLDASARLNTSVLCSGWRGAARGAAAAAGAGSRCAAERALDEALGLAGDRGAGDFLGGRLVHGEGFRTISWGVDDSSHAVLAVLEHTAVDPDRGRGRDVQGEDLAVDTRPRGRDGTAEERIGVCGRAGRCEGGLRD